MTTRQFCFGLALSWFALPAALAETEYYPPPASNGGWRSLAAESAEKLRKAAGMDRAKLDQAFDLARETTQNGGLVVVRHGYLVYERYSL